MFENATVVTPKFLQLRDKLNSEVSGNESMYGPGAGNGFRDCTKEANIRTLVKMFGELCELLHELTMQST